MKTPLLLAAILVVAISNPNIHAQSPGELEFRQARAARDKALASAAEPINRRYLETLNTLFKKATQAANLELAKAIKAEIQAVGGTTAVAAASGTTPAPAAVPATGARLNRTDLKNLIENTRWDRTGREGGGFVLFHRNGEMDGNGPGLQFMHRYEFQPPDIVRIVNRQTGAEIKRREKPSILTYQIDVTAMTLTLDAAKSTDGGPLSFKYTGPAPKK
jgi:hypothetical protein